MKTLDEFLETIFDEDKDQLTWSDIWRAAQADFKEAVPKNEYDTGMGTSKMMWEMVSGVLEGEKLPESINAAIHALCEGRAFIVEQDN